MSTNPIIQAITVDDFKSQFYRDFNYIDSWSDAATYNTGDKVFYLVNRKFYKCLSDGVSSLPTVSTDWSQISAGSNISDLDIGHAFAEADVTFNTSLFGADADMILGFLYLSAHYLVHDLNAGGVSSSSQGVASARSVGNVSESYSIPTWQLESPVYSFYTKTSYGLKYLNMVLPQIVGNVAAVAGATNA